MSKEKNTEEKINIMTINVRHDLWNAIYDVTEEASRQEIDVLFVTETGLKENNLRDSRITNACKNRGYKYYPAMKADNANAHTAFIIKSNIKIGKLNLFIPTPLGVALLRRLVGTPFRILTEQRQKTERYNIPYRSQDWHL